MKNTKRIAFSLVEVTLALGVAGFCLLAVFALLPIGVQTNQTAFSQTAAATILADVVADMRAAGLAATTAQYGITFGTRKDLYFDAEDRCSTDLGGTVQCGSGGSWSPAIQPRYRVVIKFPSATTNATCARVVISWPATGNIVDPSASDTPVAGSIETVAAFNRLP